MVNDFLRREIFLRPFFLISILFVLTHNHGPMIVDVPEALIEPWECMVIRIPPKTDGGNFQAYSTTKLRDRNQSYNFSIDLSGNSPKGVMSTLLVSPKSNHNNSKRWIASSRLSPSIKPNKSAMIIQAQTYYVPVPIQWTIPAHVRVLRVYFL